MPVVPIEAANSTAQHYYLLSFDKNGREVDDTTQDKPAKDSPPNLLSQKLLGQLGDAAAAGEPITDVFILSHGWLTTLPESQASYDAWISVVEQAKPTDVRAHVMGHSFGAKVVAEALEHGQKHGMKPIASMFLVEGAFSTWAFAGKDANPYGTTDDGSIASVLALPMVTGVAVAGTSTWDYALHRMFPAAEAIDMTLKRIRHLPWRFPSLHQPPNASLVGAIGAWGFAGFAEKEKEHTMQAGPAGQSQTHGFQPGGIYRLVTDAVVDLSQPPAGPADRNLRNPFVGAHSNIAHVEVAHAWWEAVLASR